MCTQIPCVAAVCESWTLTFTVKRWMWRGNLDLQSKGELEGRDNFNNKTGKVKY